MSRNLNKIYLIGNVGADGEEKLTQSGRPFITFSLATNLFWKDGRGQTKTKVEWHRCVCWDINFPKPKKGDCLWIQGRLGYFTWTRDGQEVKTAEINVEEYIYITEYPEVEVAKTKSKKKPPAKKKAPKKKSPQEEIEF